MQHRTPRTPRRRQGGFLVLLAVAWVAVISALTTVGIDAAAGGARAIPGATPAHVAAPQR